MRQTGYHYTTLRKWNEIKTKGFLEPKPLHNLDGLLAPSIKGIWLWKYNPKGKAHVGNLIRIMFAHGGYKVVKLRVNYDLCDVPRVARHMPHNNTIGLWNYHREMPATIITRAVPIEDMEVVSITNVVEKLTI